MSTYTLARFSRWNKSRITWRAQAKSNPHIETGFFWEGRIKHATDNRYTRAGRAQPPHLMEYWTCRDIHLVFPNAPNKRT